MTWNWRNAVAKLTLTEGIVLIAVLFGAFFRLWNFTNTLQFLGDQGRDALIVTKIFREHDPVLIGPTTSTGNMYLGPLYYYLMLPFLWLTYPSPLGPAYAIAALSIVTIGMIYVLGKELVGARAAMFASVFFAFSQFAISFARFSWNPNPAPFFGLLFIWALFKTDKKQFRFWIAVSACVAVLMQLHYVAMLTGLIAAVIWLKQLWSWKKYSATQKSEFVFSTVLAIGVFLIFLSPLIAFDLRHEFLNIRSLQSFLAKSQDALQTLPWWQKIGYALASTYDKAVQLLVGTAFGTNLILNAVFTLAILASLFFFWKTYKTTLYPGFSLLLVAYVVSVAGLSFYRDTVFEHYISYFLPLSFLLLGILCDRLLEWPVGKIGVVVILFTFFQYNLRTLPLKSHDWTVDDIEQTSQAIHDRVMAGEKYNIVLLSDTKDIYGENYRYFLTTSDRPPLKIEHFGEAETLFIIDEQKQEQSVVSLPIYEIVVFPSRTPVEVFSMPDGPQITVLKKSQ